MTKVLVAEDERDIRELLVDILFDAGFDVVVAENGVAALEKVGQEQPDIVLLDNLDCGSLREAVSLRDASAPNVLLEASGGVTLETVAQIARTGIERISIGALTHSATALDLAFYWTS